MAQNFEDHCVKTVFRSNSTSNKYIRKHVSFFKSWYIKLQKKKECKTDSHVLIIHFSKHQHER